MLLIISLASFTSQSEKAPVSVTRTEIKVSRSLNPEDTQTLNVMTRDGSVAQLIVKRRDAKSRQTVRRTENEKTDQKVDEQENQPEYGRAIYTNWVPLSNSLYYKPKIITLDTIALVRNATEGKLFNNNLGNVIDSDRYANFEYLFLLRFFKRRLIK